MNGIVIAYNVIEATGLAGALAIIITAILSHSIQRLSTWYLVLISGAVYSFSKLLLAMAHAQFGPSPNSTLCLIQSSLIYSGPIWLMASGCAFALQFYLTVLHCVKQESEKINKNNNWLPALPTILFLVVTLMLLIMAALQPAIVERDPDSFYCHIKNNTAAYYVAIFSIIFAIISITLEAKAAKVLYQHWKMKSDWHNCSNGAVSIGVMAQLMTFSLISILSVATCAVYLIPKVTNFEYIVLYNSFLTNMAVLVLGLNSSIVKSWKFWKYERPSLPRAGRAATSLEVHAATVESSLV